MSSNYAFFLEARFNQELSNCSTSVQGDRGGEPSIPELLYIVGEVQNRRYRGLGGGVWWEEAGMELGCQWVKVVGEKEEDVIALENAMHAMLTPLLKSDEVLLVNAEANTEPGGGFITKFLVGLDNYVGCRAKIVNRGHLHVGPASLEGESRQCGICTTWWWS